MIELNKALERSSPHFLLVFPLTERERRANRSVSSRRVKETESAAAGHALEVA
jgi:hypothetical protein